MKKFLIGGLAIVGGLFIAIIVVALIFGDETTDAANPSDSTVTVTGVTVRTTTTTTPRTTSTSKVADTKPSTTRSQQNAIRAAENYLAFTSFSRSGLIDQLMFEGYTKSDATFAVDHISVDWNEQAWKKAEDYLSIMPFSRQGLIDQLLFEGFTDQQARYGVDRAGL